MSLPTLQFKDGQGVNQWQPAHQIGAVGVGTAAAAGTYQPITSLDGSLATYYFAGVDLPFVATPTAYLLIKGSSTKTIRIRRIKISAMATAYGEMKIKLAKWGAAGSGGTQATATTAAKADSGNAAATAVVQSNNTANMTEGTPETVIEYSNLSFVPLTTAATSSGDFPWIFDGGRGGEQAIVLRGTSEFCVVGGDGDAVPSGGVWHFSVCITEESES